MTIQVEGVDAVIISPVTGDGRVVTVSRDTNIVLYCSTVSIEGRKFPAQMVIFEVEEEVWGAFWWTGSEWVPTELNEDEMQRRFERLSKKEWLLLALDI